jgi:hypothetical protein
MQYTLQYNIIQYPRLEQSLTQISPLDATQTLAQVQHRMREVRRPADLRVQTQVARTQASCVTAHSDLLLTAKETRGSRERATDRHPRDAHVVCAFPHTDRLVYAVSSLRSHRSSQCSAVEPYTQHVRSTAGDDGSNISPGSLRSERKGIKRGDAPRVYAQACARRSRKAWFYPSWDPLPYRLPAQDAS